MGSPFRHEQSETGGYATRPKSHTQNGRSEEGIRLDASVEDQILPSDDNSTIEGDEDYLRRRLAHRHVKLAVDVSRPRKRIIQKRRTGVKTDDTEKLERKKTAYQLAKSLPPDPHKASLRKAKKDGSLQEGIR